MRWTLCLLVAVAAASLVVAEESLPASSELSVSDSELDAALASDALVELEQAKEVKKADAAAKDKKKKKKKAKRAYVGGDVAFNRAMNVRGVMAAGSLIANNATINGTLIARQLKTKHIKSRTMSVGELKTTRLSSPTGTIVIEGDLLITHSREMEFASKPKNATQSLKAKKGKGKGQGKGKSAADAKAQPTDSKAAADAALSSKTAKGLSLLAEEVVIGGVKQWALIRNDHFQLDAAAQGWRLVSSGEAVPTSACGGSTDRFLGGHCVLANGPAAKQFTHLPPHTQLRLTARYHFIDNWRGETAFAQIEGKNVWAQTHRLSSAGNELLGVNVCGSALYPESRMSAAIDVSVEHSDSSVGVAFGVHSASSEAVRSLADEQQNACDRSFGVDDVAIYIR